MIKKGVVFTYTYIYILILKTIFFPIIMTKTSYWKHPDNFSRIDASASDNKMQYNSRQGNSTKQESIFGAFIHQLKCDKHKTGIIINYKWEESNLNDNMLTTTISANNPI